MAKKIDMRISQRLNNTTKAKLREIVSKIETIDDKKLSKMNKTECIKRLDHLSFNQLVTLSN